MLQGSIHYNYRVDDEGNNDGSIVSMPYPGHGYCLAKAPRYMSEQEWREVAKLFVEAPIMERCIRHLLYDLPTKRDWLDPHLEQDMRDIIKRLDDKS